MVANFSLIFSFPGERLEDSEGNPVVKIVPTLLLQEGPVGATARSFKNLPSAALT